LLALSRKTYLNAKHQATLKRRFVGYPGVPRSDYAQFNEALDAWNLCDLLLPPVNLVLNLLPVN
jgi:hypothetical protein